MDRFVWSFDEFLYYFNLLFVIEWKLLRSIYAIFFWLIVNDFEFRLDLDDFLEKLKYYASGKIFYVRESLSTELIFLLIISL